MGLVRHGPAGAVNELRGRRFVLVGDRAQYGKFWVGCFSGLWHGDTAQLYGWRSDRAAAAMFEDRRHVDLCLLAVQQVGHVDDEVGVGGQDGEDDSQEHVLLLRGVGRGLCAGACQG